MGPCRREHALQRQGHERVSHPARHTPGPVGRRHHDARGFCGCPAVGGRLLARSRRRRRDGRVAWSPRISGRDAGSAGGGRPGPRTEGPMEGTRNSDSRLSCSSCSLVAIFAASWGAAALPPIGEIMMLVGLFLVFFGSGVYIAVVLGALALLSGLIFSDRPFWLFLGQVIWAPSSGFVLVAVPLFPADGRDPVAVGAIQSNSTARSISGCAAGRAACCIRI